MSLNLSRNTSTMCSHWLVSVTMRCATAAQTVSCDRQAMHAKRREEQAAKAEAQKRAQQAQQAAAAPPPGALPGQPGLPPGPIDLSGPMSDAQLLQLGHSMLADQNLAKQIGHDYPALYKRVRACPTCPLRLLMACVFSACCFSQERLELMSTRSRSCSCTTSLNFSGSRSHAQIHESFALIRKLACPIIAHPAFAPVSQLMS